jgi:UDP-N-acetyl-D-mannosaminuronic acid dehydrogenase
MTDKIAIVGIGRVGLPLALFLAGKGFHVRGIDLSSDYVAGIKRGEMPFIEKGADAALKACIGRSFFPTTDISVIADCRYVILTLGTPVDEHMNPVHGQIESVVSDVCAHLRPGSLLILRSTVSPGTTEHIARYINEQTSFTVGEDMFLAFCPERIAEGNSLEELGDIPQIIGGAEEKSTAMAAEFFERSCDLVLPTDARSAELAKLYCNMYRYIDFAIANEFMMLAHQYDRQIYDIVSLVNTGYKRGGLKSPGFSGGPCLYKDGFFLLSKTPFTELIYTSWKINESVPGFLLQKIADHVKLDRQVFAVLGLAFKKNIDDSRNSLSYKLKKLIHQDGHEVLLHDPYLEPRDLEAVIKKADVVIVAVNHDYYLDKLDEIIEWAKPDTVFCDIWNLFGTGKICFSAASLKQTANKSADDSAEPLLGSQL